MGGTRSQKEGDILFTRPGLEKTQEKRGCLRSREETGGTRSLEARWEGTWGWGGRDLGQRRSHAARLETGDGSGTGGVLGAKGPHCHPLHSRQRRVRERHMSFHLSTLSTASLGPRPPAKCRGGSDRGSKRVLLADSYLPDVLGGGMNRPWAGVEEMSSGTEVATPTTIQGFV